MKGRDDPVALAEEEYPDWLWTCLDKKKVEGEEGGAEGDEFCEFFSVSWAIQIWSLDWSCSRERGLAERIG